MSNRSILLQRIKGIYEFLHTPILYYTTPQHKIWVFREYIPNSKDFVPDCYFVFQTSTDGYENMSRIFLSDWSTNTFLKSSFSYYDLKNLLNILIEK